MPTNSRDRTAEFFSAVEVIRKHMPVNAKQKSSSNILKSNDQQKPKNQFLALSIQLGRDIHSVSAKLQKLAKLTQNNTLFNDRTQEIQELTYIIKQEMNQLTRQIDQLEQNKLNLIGSTINKQTEEHSGSVVKSLKVKLQSITINFKDILEKRKENIKTQQDRKQNYDTPKKMAKKDSILFNKPSNDSVPLLTASVLQQEEEKKSDNNSTVSIPMPQSNNMQLQMYAPQQDNYLLERTKAIENVETTIRELGSIFSRLTTMIVQQRETVDQIEAFVEESAVNVEEGENQLGQYYTNVKKNRWLIFKIFMIMLIFIVIFVVFFV